MTQERSKHRDFLALQVPVVFISKSISKKLLIKNHIFDFNFLELLQLFHRSHNSQDNMAGPKGEQTRSHSYESI